MVWQQIGLALCLVLVLYCMIIRPSSISWLRLPNAFLAPSKHVIANRDPLHLRSREIWNQRVNFAQAVMLRKAIDAHTVASQNKIKLQQLFSSSPTGQDPSLSIPRKNHIQNSTSTSHTLHPSTPSALNVLAKRPPGVNIGVKRTANGLAKALGGGAEECFEEPLHLGSVESASNSGVVIDENDFDSDLDLDVEDPGTKESISYPQITPKFASKRAVNYPTIQSASLHTQVSNDAGSLSTTTPCEQALPPSSMVAPWSSSPPEHLAPPPHINTFAKYTLDSAAITSSVAPLTALMVDNDPNVGRPSKRRTLPWLDNESDNLPAKPSKSTNNRNNGQQHTPVTKKPPSSVYPWNTTASAIKEQQKQLRLANKKLIKTNEATDEAKAAAIAITKSKSVARPHLTTEQRQVLDLVVDHGKSVFFTGSAGTGKSVLLREIIAVLRKKFQRESDRVAITASTGLAACNVGGVTLHSFAGIGLGKEDVPELVRKIKRNQKAKHRWLRTKILIIDEISMVDGELFDKLEEVARCIRANGRPFGGIQLVITGDFFQLPPVPEYNKIATFSFDAKTWSSAIEHTIGLHHVFRQKDPKFANMLNEMREGRLTAESISAFRKLSRPLEFSDLIPTELFPTRSEVDAANNSRMKSLGGDVVTFLARDGGTILDKDQRDKLLSNCMAPQILELKKGSQVMLIKNIDEMLVNGSLGKVLGFMNEATFAKYDEDEGVFKALQSTPDTDLNPAERKAKLAMLAANTGQTYPLVRFAIADGTTRDLLCNREVWKVELPNGEVQASRSQVPLILAWALSIHKAQGQTLERVKVDLGKVFEKGQAYVALSRATTMNGLQVLRFDEKKVMAHDRVRNFYAGLSRAESARRNVPGEFPGGDDFDDEYE